MPASSHGLIARCLRASLSNPWLVVVASAALLALGVVELRHLPIDALPDLSDVQVIVRTSFPGQSPQVVEDQVTFPLTSALRSVPRATVVRGYSLFGDSFVYVLFEDGTDPYWARSRVTEYLASVAPRLPSGARPVLGPDATGIGWIFEYALRDRSGRNDIARLRALQDWWLRLELQSVPGVAEVASVGGMVKEYQVVADPDRLRAYGIPLADVRTAIERGSGAAGGSVIELAEAEYVVRASAYIATPDDVRAIPIRLGSQGKAVTIGDLAEVRLGPELRRGMADLDGAGEVAGGVVLLRYGADALATLRLVRARLAELAPRLPEGVEVIPTYDRSALIESAVATLGRTLIEELLVVLLVSAVFLGRVRSGLVPLAVLPLAIVAALLLMRAHGLTANIMSLAGLALAIGAMVDAAIVMTENVHKKLERLRGPEPSDAERLELIAAGLIEVGPPLFFCLLIVALSFVPVLALQAQEGRLFASLAYTKTYAMLAAAVVSIVVTPALIRLLVRGRPIAERDDPVSRACERVYRPLLELSLRRPKGVLIAAALLVLTSVWPLSQMGTEFMPDMDEGDLLYMPVTLPGISADAARALLQQMDRRIAAVPEVDSVFGKAGRADTATDPAPPEMFETVVRLKPRSAWRAGLTPEMLRAELDAQVDFPGVSNAWLPPIRARLEMLETGVRTPLGLKIFGPDGAELTRIAVQVERIVSGVPGASAVYAERNSNGRYVQVDVDRNAAARFGLNVADVLEIADVAVGGRVITETIEGRERYPISLRYPQDRRDSLDRLRQLPIVTASGAQITLGDVATVSVQDGPAAIRSEDGQLYQPIYVVPSSSDVAAFAREAERRIDAAGILPAGYSLRWSGQYEYMQRAFGRLELILPLVLAIMLIMLYASSKRVSSMLLVLVSLPVALLGGAWLQYFLGYHMSVAVAVGYLALGGVAVETGVVMLLYLNTAWDARRAAHARPSRGELLEAVTEGALLRLRPKLMTVITIMAALLPILVGGGTGSELTKRVAAPMVGGIVTALFLTLLVIPAAFLLINERRCESRGTAA